MVIRGCWHYADSETVSDLLILVSAYFQVNKASPSNIFSECFDAVSLALM